MNTEEIILEAEYPEMQFVEYRQMLDESFKNFFPKDVEKKQSHAQEVFDLLQSAYSTQGGIHGDGFKSPQDMIDNVPLWKIRKNQGKVVAAAMYKDTGTGRKRVAIGTDGSEHGKKVAADIVTSDLRHDRAHMEVSGKSLSFLKKNIDLTNLAHSFDSAQEYHQNRGDTIDRPSENDPEVTRHPELADKMYSRKIGSHIHTKILLGAIGKSIKEKNGVKVS